MARLQLSAAIRAAQVSAIVEAVGEEGQIELRSEGPPPNCNAPNAGQLLAAGQLPAQWIVADESGGASAETPWELTASRKGIIGHFRITRSGVCHMQGDVTLPGGNGAMHADRLLIEAPGQRVEVRLSLKAGNA